jgi:catechol 2,3-dioxygenase-like lactoylglutathione lyase family enzyme
MILPHARIVQMAFVVTNLEAAAARFSRTMGIGPFLLNPHIQLTDPHHRGVPVRTDFSLALAQAGEVQVELVEQHDDTPSVYRDIYAPGAEGFHHVAIIVADVAAEVARLRALGFEQASSGRFGDADFAYVDTAPALGHMVEVLPDNETIRRFFAKVRREAEAWDGSGPVLRPM